MFSLAPSCVSQLRIRIVCPQRLSTTALLHCGMLDRIQRRNASVRAGPRSQPSGGLSKQAPSRGRRRAKPVELSAQTDHSALIDALQGKWGDDIGLSIEVTQEGARFTDGSGLWKFEHNNGHLELRGARLTGTVEAPKWEFPTGVERFWARLEPAGSGDTAWISAFHRFKEQRLDIQRQLHAAFVSQDFERVITLNKLWEEESVIDPSISDSQRDQLVSGRYLIPGMCFRHKKFDYRGVIMACAPLCTYPAAWRALWVPDRPHGEMQPFYHCLVDERDRPGNQGRFVAEENMVLSNVIFPLQARLVDLLFTRCDQLGGYLPGVKLEEALRQQKLAGDFSL